MRMKWDSSPSSSSFSSYFSDVTMVMVGVEFLEQGQSTLSKAAMTRGMSNFIFVLYSNSLALFFLLPFALFLYWKTALPKITPSIICRIFLLGLLGCFMQLFLYIGIGYSSPTLASAMTDLTPAFTFILAIISRMEKVDLRVPSSRAKFIGTSMSMIGALTVTLYKGLPLVYYNAPTIETQQQFLLSPQPNWILGALFLASAALVLSVLYIVQTWIIKDYPAEVVVAMFSCLFTAILSAIVAVALEKDTTAWILKPGIELIAIGYSAIFAVAIRNVAHTWACHTKGPLYVSMFKPLGMVIAIVMTVSLLKDSLYLGSVVGAVIIAVGFYSVLWGKTKEEEEKVGDCLVIVHTSGSSSIEAQAPLLDNHILVESNVAARKSS